MAAARGIGEPAFKVCRTCKKRRRIASFTVAKRWPDGSIRWRYSYCRECDKKRRAEWKRKRREDPAYVARERAKRRYYYELYRQDPEQRERQRRKQTTAQANAKRRERYRRKMQRLQSQPNNYQRHLELNRLYAWEARRRQGKQERGPVGGVSEVAKGEQVPAAPFIAWLRHFVEANGKAESARILGIGDRQMYGLLHEPRKTVGVRFVDRALTRTETPLWALYPGLYPDMDPEAAAGLVDRDTARVVLEAA